MQSEQLDEFTQIMQVVAEQYSKPMTDNLVALYWQALQDYDLAAVRDALGRHLRNTDTGQFMPKVADIIRMMQGSSQDSALSAWAKVDKAVRHVGPYESVVFDDPLIHVVLHEMGGWIALGQKTEDEWPFVAKEFENRYRGFKSRGEVPQYAPKMIGLSEAHNSKEGFRIAAPMMIGDAEKAKSVMLGGTNKPLLGMTKLRVDDNKLQLVKKEAA